MPATAGRTMDVLNAFGLLCALVWGVGAFQLTAEMPPLSPTREQICQGYARPGDLAAAPAPLPAEIGPIAQYGRPYWGTWMPPYTPQEPATPDPYPSCMQNAHAMALAQARFEDEWAAWREVRLKIAQLWAAAPFAGLPLLVLIGFLWARFTQNRKAPQAAAKPQYGSASAKAKTGEPIAPKRIAAGIRRSAMGAKRL